MYPYNHKKGQRIQTDTPGVDCDRAFLAHIHIPAAQAVAANAAGILPLTNLGAAPQAITEGITTPAVPRNVQIDGNVAGIIGDVKITGTNYAGDVITETLAANGTTNVAGVLAFKTVTKVELPVQVHAPVAQVETVAVTAGSDKIATLVVTVTAAGMTNSPKAVNVDVIAADNEVGEVAAKVRAALTADPDVGAFFTVSGADANVILTAKTPAADDATLAIALTDAATSTVTFGASGDTTAGVPYDKISVGWGDIFGLPYMLPYDTTIKTLFNGAADTMTIVADADELEKNTFDMTGVPDGLKDIDIYLIV